MLTIEFLNSDNAAPEADNPVSYESSAGAAPALGRVSYLNLWDGVTLVYEAGGESLVKSTYYVDATREGVQVDRIRMGYNRPVQIDEKGNLLITYEDGTITDGAPVAWQEVEGGRKPVTAAYVLHGEREVGFSLGSFVPGIPVVIDPVMTWNTFMGGSGSDYANAIAVDSIGNVYVGGYSTATWGSPVRAYASGYDAFAAKLDSSGALQWNTFLGGSGYDLGYAIAVDGSGNVYIGGCSNATWQGTSSPVRAYTSSNDAFAAQLNSSGDLQWNTFLGGNGDDFGYAIAVDGSGNVYAGGHSSATWQGTSSPVRAYTSGDDAFAAKLDSSGNLMWNTFTGGSGYDFGRGIAVDGSGNIYVGGYGTATWGSPVRAYTSGFDAFAAKLNSSGALQWNTFLGGSGTSDYGLAISVDSSSNVYVGGYSNATWGSPVRAYTSWIDAFAAKLDSSGALQWNTFLSGSGDDYCYAIAVDSSGNVYVGGQSEATWGSPVRAHNTGGSIYDSFAAKLNSGGALQWNTFLGDSGNDYCYALTVDGSGNVHVGGYSDATWASPVRAYTSGDDALVVKLDANGNFVPGWASYNDSGRTVPDDTFASPETTVYMKGSSIANVSYLIAYYDANGVKRGSETQSASSGVLQGTFLLTTVPSAAAGTWHTLMQPSSGYTDFGTQSYATITATPGRYGLTADDSFTVAASALPEFPTIFAAIGAIGLCFATYWWLRRRPNYVQA